jgi:UDP-N-acetylmuramate: L-alanyl-gamma-D-glutamyl-meso-diaminopimelate ligase
MAVALTDSLLGADHSYVLARPDLRWDAHTVLGGLGAKLTVREAVEPLVADLLRDVRPGDRVLVMSNGDFCGIHRKLLDALKVG